MYEELQLSLQYGCVVLHMSLEEVKIIRRQTGFLTRGIEEARYKVNEACGSSKQTGRPLPSKIIMLTHLSEAFKPELLLKFCVWTNSRTEAPVAGHDWQRKGSAKVAIVENRSLTTVGNTFDKIWIYHYGSPLELSADDKFHKSESIKFLESGGFISKPRPARTHNKSGIVEQNIQTKKTHFSKSWQATYQNLWTGGT